MKKLLFLGDSITDCYHSFDVDNLGEGYVRIIAEKLGYGFGNVKVSNMGYDGFTLPALKRLWNRISTERSYTISNDTDIPSTNDNLNPDFITILIGINDIAVMKNTGTDPILALDEFKVGYKTLIEQIKKSYNCSILLMEPFIFPHPAEYAAWEPELRLMNEIIKKIAEIYHICYLPLWDKLKENADRYGYNTITTDGIHLTTEGHRLIADSWLDYFHSSISTIMLTLP